MDVLKGKQTGSFSIQMCKWFGGKTDSLILFWIMTGLIVGGLANISNTETSIRFVFCLFFCYCFLNTEPGN